MIDRLDVQFDVDKIQSDLEKIVFVDLDFNQQTYQTTNQISLRGDDWFDGNGSLYDYAKQKFVRETAEFSYTSKKLTGTYLEQVIAKVRTYNTMRPWRHLCRGAWRPVIRACTTYLQRSQFHDPEP